MENHPYSTESLLRTSSDQKGFAVISLVVLSPLLMAAMIFLYGATTQIEIRSEMLQTCRSETLKAQAQTQVWLKALMALNPYVEMMEDLETLSTLSILLPGVGPVIMGVLQGVISTVENSMMAIPILQKRFIEGMLLSLQTHQMAIQFHLHQILRQFEFKTRLLFLWRKHPLQKVWSRSPSVEPEHPEKKISKYRLKRDFEHLQTLGFHWSYGLELSGYLKSWSPWSQRFRGSCAGTLKKEEPWEPTLIVDRS